MREIKFRAWLEGKNEHFTIKNPHMEYDVILSKDGCFNEINPDGSRYKYANVPVMQFTGLKDKNGIEIYDGDILKSNNLDATIRINWSKIWVCWECFDFSGTENFGLLSNIPLKNYSVIGNIYENPELLKNKVNK